MSVKSEELADAVPYDEDGHILVRRPKAWVAEVILNRPERLNALVPGMGEGIQRAMHELGNDDSVKVVVLRGVGRAFSTGGDMSWVGTQYTEEVPPGEKPRKPSQRSRLTRDQHAGDTWSAIFHCNKVVIAEGKGYVLGVSLDWFLAADIIICSDDTVLGYPPSRMIAASGVNTLYWLLRMGPALHAEITLMGRFISAEEGHRHGLINRVVPRDNLEATVDAAVDSVCNLHADGLHISKLNKRIAYEMLGLKASELESMMGHTLQVQQRIEEGEWNLMRERNEFGVKGSFQRRDERFRDAARRYDPDGIIH
jgi:enoyl-CoA hydratase